MEANTLEEVNKAFHEMKTLVEKNALSPEVKSKIDGICDSYEETNQKLVAAEQKALAHEEEVKALRDSLEAKDVSEGEIKSRVEDLEAELARKAEAKEIDYRDGADFKALQDWVTSGESPSDVETKALLRTDSAVSGGYLVTTEMNNEIIKKITEIDGLRAVSRVRSISSKAIEMPIRNTIPTAEYEGEAEQGTESVSAYENVTVTPYRQTFTTPITQDMLQDSSFNMEAEIVSDAQEAFAFGEGQGFISGSGVKTPEGILTNSTVTAAARNTTASSSVAAVDVVTLTGDLKVGYNPVYVMNRRTLAYIRSLRDTNGQFLWQPGFNGPVTNTLNGFPYILCNSMPDYDTTNAYSIAFGDFRRGYVIVDRTGMSIVRDDVTQKRKAIVEFTMNRWNTGKVVLPEAIKLLKSTA